MRVSCVHSTLIDFSFFFFLNRAIAVAIRSNAKLYRVLFSETLNMVDRDVPTGRDSPVVPCSLVKFDISTVTISMIVPGLRV